MNAIPNVDELCRAASILEFLEQSFTNVGRVDEYQLTEGAVAGLSFILMDLSSIVRRATEQKEE